LAKGIINQHPGGIRFAALIAQIQHESPETSRNQISGNIWNLEQTERAHVVKPVRGLYKPANAVGNEAVVVGDTEQTAPSGDKIRESDFYEPFADWLKKDLDEATDALALGGASLKSKWGTPDVVGVYKPLAGNLIKFPLEIVSVEIKIDPQAPVVAFGQAVAYRLFSAKTYIAMPSTLSPEDQDRLESLCMLFGVGLVLFDVHKDNPNFSIRVRAQRFSPDMFYVNEFAERLKSHDAQIFEQLFR
jgi:hypothetical protein